VINSQRVLEKIDNESIRITLRLVNNNKVDKVMKINMQFKFISHIFLLIIFAVFLSACSTVRDATDWVPGVDSNEDVKRKDMEAQRSERHKEKKDYYSKAAYVPTGPQAEIDAEISVIISQRYALESTIAAGEIGIEVHSGVVTLSGTTKTEEAAVKAIALAKSVNGVTRVISKLIIISVR